MSLKTKVGQEVTGEELKNQTIEIIQRSITTAVDEVLRPDRYIKHVAKLSGALRDKLITMIKNQITFDQSQSEITIEFDEGFMATLHYAPYHIDGRPHHPGDFHYDKPTTSGTRPINRGELMNQIAVKTNVEIRKNLKAAGLN